MKRITSVGLVFAGIVIGCGTAAIAPHATSFAQAPGEWRCFVVDRFPDVQEAAGWRGAAYMAQGLNQVARHVPAGTITTAYWSQNSSSVACVKY